MSDKSLCSIDNKIAKHVYPKIRDWCAERRARRDHEEARQIDREFRDAYNRTNHRSGPGGAGLFY